MGEEATSLQTRQGLNQENELKGDEAGEKAWRKFKKNLATAPHQITSIGKGMREKRPAMCGTTKSCFSKNSGPLLQMPAITDSYQV